MRIDGDREIRREQKFAPVRFCILDVIDRDARGAAGLVLDDDCGRIATAQAIGQDAGDQIGRTACRKSDDDVDGLSQCLRFRAHGTDCGSDSRGGEGGATGQHVGVSLHLAR